MPTLSQPLAYQDTLFSNSVSKECPGDANFNNCKLFHALALFLVVNYIFQVSVGTLLAFTMVSISVLILRYVPPDVVPLPSSLQGPIDIISSRYSNETNIQDIKVTASGPCKFVENEEKRRKVAGWTIALTCFGILLLTGAASSNLLQSAIRYTLCAFGGVILLSGLAVLTCIGQDDARHNFGRTGGFVCPFIPLLPVGSILFNAYLLISLGGQTWAFVSIWMLVGFIVYVCYGRTHSVLRDAVYVPAAHVDEIYEASSNSVA